MASRCDCGESHAHARSMGCFCVQRWIAAQLLAAVTHPMCVPAAIRLPSDRLESQAASTGKRCRCSLAVLAVAELTAATGL